MTVRDDDENVDVYETVQRRVNCLIFSFKTTTSLFVISASSSQLTSSLIKVV